MSSADTMTPEIIGQIVTQGGLPCTLYNAAQTRRGGVLVPRRHAGEPVVFFGTPRDARRAITRTTRIAARLKGSLVDDWARLAPLLAGKPYEITPLMRSHVAGKKQTETAASDGGEAALSAAPPPTS